MYEPTEDEASMNADINVVEKEIEKTLRDAENLLGWHVECGEAMMSYACDIEYGLGRFKRCRQWVMGGAKSSYVSGSEE